MYRGGFLLNIPALKKSSRVREFNSYNQDIKDKIVYFYLFEGKSHRELDEELLNLNSEYSRGWQSMGVLHYMGITNEFKALFTGISIKEAINQLENEQCNEYAVIIDSLRRYYDKNNTDKAEQLYKAWMISANSKLYRHADSFAARGYIDWRQKAKYSVGDNVFIYCTKPYMRVMFKTIVEKVNMVFSEITDDKEYWVQIDEYEKSKKGMYCRLKLVEQVDTHYLDLSNLLKHGLKMAPQGPIKLKRELLEYINNNFDDFYYEDYFTDISDEDKIYEGLKKTVTVNKYERSSVARSKCVEYNGCYCHVCGLDFQEVYGELGKDFIHVHHIKPLSEIDSTYVVDYKNDLIPICPNCHAMLHRRLNGKEISIEQLRRIYSYYTKLNVDNK